MHDTSLSPNTARERRREADWMGFIGLAASVAVLCVSAFSGNGFHEWGSRWSSPFLALAGFSLGLGAAYFVFARYRAQQTEQLREEYASLHSRAEILLARIRPESADSSSQDSL